MTSELSLSLDTQATLLLCGYFGKGSAEVKPLTVTEYNQVAKELVARGLRPADLLAEVPSDIGIQLVTRDRLERLVGRGAAMALRLDRWMQVGINVIGRSDPDYPLQLRSRLKSLAPPILYVAGDRRLLAQDSVCIVGSRDATSEGLVFARRLGRACAANGLLVVSGDARGVDREAMWSVLENDGRAIGLLAERLEKAVVIKKNRDAILHGRLVLVSPFEPDAVFTVARAMERNKFLYALARAAVIADSDVKGGTWSGALENHRYGWVPAFVWTGMEMREGNHKLVELGLTPITEVDLNRTEPLLSVLNEVETLRGHRPPAIPDMPLLSSLDTIAPPQELHERENMPVEIAANNRDDGRDLPQDRLFQVFLCELQRFLEENSRSEKEIAEYFEIERGQAKRWLERAIERHSLKRKGRPAHYIIEKSLF
jgi:predicted Rossmann fold nucleotide-binding protein DprA/Smf involved in DNA uptake